MTNAVRHVRVSGESRLRPPFVSRRWRGSRRAALPRCRCGLVRASPVVCAAIPDPHPIGHAPKPDPLPHGHQPSHVTRHRMRHKKSETCLFTTRPGRRRTTHDTRVTSTPQSAPNRWRRYTHTLLARSTACAAFLVSCARAPARPVQCSRDENVRAAVLLASGRASARPPICRSAPPPVCEGRHPFDRLSVSCRLRQQNFHR